MPCRKSRLDASRGSISGEKVSTTKFEMPLQGGLSIERMCQLAQVSRAGFYRYLGCRAPEEEDMTVRSAIQEIALEHERYSRRLSRAFSTLWKMATSRCVESISSLPPSRKKDRRHASCASQPAGKSLTTIISNQTATVVNWSRSK